MAMEFGPNMSSLGSDECQLDICSTRFVEEKVTYTWNILGFRKWPNNEYETRSPVFRDPTLNKWSIEISKDSRGSYYLTILLLSIGDSDPVRASVKALVAWEGSSKIEVPIVESHLFKVGEAVPRKHIKDFTEPKCIATDWMKLECEVSVVRSLVEVMPAPVSTLVDDLALLLKTGEGADVCLVPGGFRGESIMAHSSVLRARSDVFTDMLESSMGCQVPPYTLMLPDVTPRVLVELLLYMYTDRTTLLADMADELLVVADRYQIRRLKHECELALADQLSVENASRTYALSVTHSCHMLQQVVFPFVQRNYASLNT